MPIPIYITDSTGQTWQIGVNNVGSITAVKVTIPNPARVGGYPSLETVMNLVRVFLNDWQPGATGTPGEGQITTDNPALSPQTLPALNSAIREVYRELRNVGDPTLIKDNVLVNLPANSVTGPSVQTSLGFNGYFDGGYLKAFPSLPADLLYPVELWEQQTNGPTTGGAGLIAPNGSVYELGVNTVGALTTDPIPRTADLFETDADGVTWDTGITTLGQPTTALAIPPTTPITLPFIRMRQPQDGLPSRNQTFALGEWEWRQDQLNFVGSLAPVTIRIRYLAALAQFVSPVNFSTTLIPIMDCEEAVAYKTAAKIAKALSGITPATTDLATSADTAMFQLKNAITRRAQSVEYHRSPYSSDHGDHHDRNLI